MTAIDTIMERVSITIPPVIITSSTVDKKAGIRAYNSSLTLKLSFRDNFKAIIDITEVADNRIRDHVNMHKNFEIKNNNR